MLRLALLAAGVCLLASCQNEELACPAYKAFDGIYLDYRQVDLPGSVGGEICLDTRCRSLAAWRGQAPGSEPGRVLLGTDGEVRTVALRVSLTSSGTSRRVTARQQVELLPVYGAERRCGPYGYSRSVVLTPTGLSVGGTAPGS